MEDIERDLFKQMVYAVFFARDAEAGRAHIKNVMDVYDGFRAELEQARTRLEHAEAALKSVCDLADLWECEGTLNEGETEFIQPARAYFVQSPRDERE